MSSCMSNKKLLMQKLSKILLTTAGRNAFAEFVASLEHFGLLLKKLVPPRVEVFDGVLLPSFLGSERLEKKKV